MSDGHYDGDHDGPKNRTVSASMDAQELIERVMTEHWDMISCWCRFCRYGRELGFRPRTGYPTVPKVSILKCIDNGIGYEGEVIKRG